MKQKIAEKWIDALQSGEYKQTRSTLKDKNAFCCLGVLCDLFRKETGVGSWAEDEAGEYFATARRQDYAYLPVYVVNWAGMKSGDGDFGKETLTHLNDQGRTFPEIAEIIKKNVRNL